MTGYVAHEVDYAIIEIDDDALPASSFGVAPMALALRLRVWNEVNGAEARLIEAASPLEPSPTAGALRADGGSPRLR